MVQYLLFFVFISCASLCLLSIGGIVPAKALKNMQIHYIVMANPDGVMISQISSSRWKANAKGVDLNRNFPAKKFTR